MRTTKKIVSAVLAACMLASTAVVQALPQQPMTVRQFQATTQETILTQRLLKILTLSMLIPAMILVLLTQKMLQHSRFGHRQQPVLSSMSLQQVRMTSRVQLELPATHLKKCSLTVSGRRLDDYTRRQMEGLLLHILSHNNRHNTHRFRCNKDL